MNRDIYKLLVTHGKMCHSKFPRLYTDDLEIVNLLIDNKKIKYKSLPKAMRCRREIVIRCIQQDLVNYDDLGKRFKDDREIIREVIKNKPHMIEYIEGDKELMEIAVDNTVEYIHYVRKFGGLDLTVKMFARNPCVMLREAFFIISDKNEALKYINAGINVSTRLISKLLCDEDVIAACIKQKFYDNFAKFPEKYLSNYDIALAAVLDHNNNYEHINESLRNNREFSLKIISKHPDCFHLLPKQFVTDREFIKYFAHNVDKLPENLCDDINFAREAIKLSAGSYFKFSKRIRENKEIVLNVVSNYFWNYELLPTHLQTDKDVINAFITHRGTYCLPTYLFKDKEIANYLIDNYKFNSIPVCDSIDESMTLRLLRKNHICYPRLPQQMYTNAEIVIELMCRNDDTVTNVATINKLSDKDLIKIVKSNIIALVNYWQCAHLCKNSDIIAYYHKIPFAFASWFSIDRVIAGAKDNTLCEFSFNF